MMGGLDGGGVQDGGRVKGYVGELAEGGKVVFAITTGCADPSDWSGDDEALEWVVRKP